MNPGIKMWDGLCDLCRSNKSIVKENKVVGIQTKKLEAASIHRPTLQGRNLTVEEQKEKDAKERAEIARTGILFDLNNFANYWHNGDKRYYFERLRKASPEELLRFRQIVRGQKSVLKKRQAFSNPQFSLYDLLGAAINHELLKRRPFLFSIYKSFLPLRKKLAWWLGHREAHYHDEFGIIFVYKESYNFFYAPVSKHLRALQRFWLLHWKWVLNTSGGVGLGVLLYEFLQKKTH